MRKLLILFVFVVFPAVIKAQKFDALSKSETQLISDRSDEKMRVYNLKNHGDSVVLKSVSIEINPNDSFTKLLAQRMLLTVQDYNHRGVGIAAPQVGISRRIIVVQRFDKDGNPFEIFVNPKIIRASHLMQSGSEGDLSFEQRGTVKRNYLIEIEYQNLSGEIINELLEGFTAVIFQHERDHLDGILLTDRIHEQQNKNFVESTKSASLFYEESKSE